MKLPQDSHQGHTKGSLVNIIMLSVQTVQPQLLSGKSALGISLCCPLEANPWLRSELSLLPCWARNCSSRTTVTFKDTSVLSTDRSGPTTEQGLSWGTEKSITKATKDVIAGRGRLNSEAVVGMNRAGFSLLGIRAAKRVLSFLN